MKKKRKNVPRKRIKLCPVCWKQFKNLRSHFSALTWVKMRSKLGRRKDKFAKAHDAFWDKHYHELNKYNDS